MKKLISALLIFVAITTVVYAAFVFSYDNSKPPSIPLPIAYEHAMSALGVATNQFHCISANVTTDFGPNGEWQFIFYSTNSRPKWVTVEFNGKIHIEDVLNR
jgi:hypothetical protein